MLPEHRHGSEVMVQTSITVIGPLTPCSDLDLGVGTCVVNNVHKLWSEQALEILP